MAVTGLYFVFYVLMHMYGNLKILAGYEAFDEYAEHLRTMLVPILPHSGFLWLFRLSLVLALLLHLRSAFTLWSRANGARPVKYQVKKAVGASVSSKWMRWGGVALLLFLIFHLIQFTISKVNFNGAFGPEKLRGADGHTSTGLLVIASFQLWWVVLIYLVALLALAMHLHHGTWSAFQTLGWTNTARSRATAKSLGLFFAIVVVAGFMIPPLAILFGAVK